MIPGRIVGAFLAMFVLSILPLPPVINASRPAWLLLLFLYLQTYMPRYFHVLSVLFFGLCLDVLLATTMGEHAFALVMTTWLMVGRTQRFMFFSIIHQTLVVGLACGCYALILFVADASFGHVSSLLPVLGVAVTSMLCWPLLVRLLQGVQDVRKQDYCP
ncbi:MAG: rod shape-determining protein MreD [Gammaproteobacteria bacterium]|nr:rod shape-determining protein MreD [Gammaproteobacteria bacterium]